MTSTRISSIVAVALFASAAGTAPSHAGFGDNDQQRQERWLDIQKTIFGDKTSKVDDAAVKLGAR
jgi:hypothetical protein